MSIAKCVVLHLKKQLTVESPPNPLYSAIITIELQFMEKNIIDIRHIYKYQMYLILLKAVLKKCVQVVEIEFIFFQIWNLHRAS